MFSENQIRQIVIKKLSNKYSTVTERNVKHISDMLVDIQSYLIDNKPNSKFVELCSNEKWHYAEGIADSLNRQVLTETTIFQDFVKIVARERKINKILKDE